MIVLGLEKMTLAVCGSRNGAISAELLATNMFQPTDASRLDTVSIASK
jgi:hypothetical protein